MNLAQGAILRLQFRRKIVSFDQRRWQEFGNSLEPLSPSLPRIDYRVVVDFLGSFVNVGDLVWMNIVLKRLHKDFVVHIPIVELLPDD